jgi:hypothetical protein
MSTIAAGGPAQLSSHFTMPDLTTSVGQWGRPFAHLLWEVMADARRHPRPALAVVVGILLADA